MIWTKIKEIRHEMLWQVVISFTSKVGLLSPRCQIAQSSRSNAPSRRCSERGTPSFGGQGTRWERQRRWRRPRRLRRSRRSKHYLEKVTTSCPRTVEVQNRMRLTLPLQVRGKWLG